MFKVGDRVKITDLYPNITEIGKIGTIISVCNHSKSWYNRILNTLNLKSTLTNKNRTLLIYEVEIELVKEQEDEEDFYV